MTSDQPTPPASTPASPAPSPLAGLVRELEQHVAEQGWDQPPRLFALVRTDELLSREPHLAQLLGVQDELGPAAGYTSLEQEELPSYATLEDLLAGIIWPPEVAGAALVAERLMVPPAAEEGLPDDEQEALAVLQSHPAREDIRLAVAVLRDGSRYCALRMRSHDDPIDVVTGPDLTQSLPEQLLATLEP